MWLNPDFVHRFIFTKTAQTTVDTSFAPTQTSYTITMGGTSSISNTDYTKGVTSQVLPAVSLKSLYYNHIYKTNWTLASSIFLITEFGFNLTGDNGVQIGTVSSTSNGGLVGLTFNTSNNNTIIMDRWYVINGTTHSATQYWAVISEFGSDHSVKNFFTDLDSYMDSGMFGLESFGFKLIVFFGMFIFIGVMSFKYGLQNEGILSILVFGVVFWVDYGLDLIPTVVGMPYFPTFIVGLITLGVLTRGWKA